VATGTDTAGSVRIPAAACGISAIKPTFGRLPMDGVIPLARSLDHAGPMARTVADCAAVLAAMADGPPPAVPAAPPAPFVPSAAGSVGPLPLAASSGTRPLAGTRIASLPAPPDVELHDDVAAGVEAAAAACARLGATVLRPAPPAFAALGDFGAILHGEAAAYHVRHAERADRYRPFLREVLAHARESASLPRYLAAQEARAGLVAEWEAWMDAERLDLMLQATVTDPAPPRILGYAASAPAPDPWILLTFTWDMAGFPVVALPAGIGARSGLPVGVSLIARRGAEAPLVGAAINVQERELPPLDPVVREA
jgi:aspartyl-tRNA(Asn)/glutamyl-tRNA(Gln) amidotransferase subunit A